MKREKIIDEVGWSISKNPPLLFSNPNPLALIKKPQDMRKDDFDFIMKVLTPLEKTRFKYFFHITTNFVAVIKEIKALDWIHTLHNWHPKTHKEKIEKLITSLKDKAESSRTSYLKPEMTIEQYLRLKSGLREALDYLSNTISAQDIRDLIEEAIIRLKERKTELCNGFTLGGTVRVKSVRQMIAYQAFLLFVIFDTLKKRKYKEERDYERDRKNPIWRVNVTATSLHKIIATILQGAYGDISKQMKRIKHSAVRYYILRVTRSIKNDQELEKKLIFLKDELLKPHP